MTSSNFKVEREGTRVEIMQVFNYNKICLFTQRRTYGWQGCLFNETFAEKSKNQLSHVWREHKTAIKRQLEIFPKIESWKEKFRYFSIHSQVEWMVSSNQFQVVHMNGIPVADDPVTLKIPLFDINIVAGNIVKNFARRSMEIRKYCTTTETQHS